MKHPADLTSNSHLSWLSFFASLASVSGNRLAAEAYLLEILAFCAFTERDAQMIEGMS